VYEMLVSSVCRFVFHFHGNQTKIQVTYQMAPIKRAVMDVLLALWRKIFMSRSRGNAACCVNCLGAVLRGQCLVP
jgi:hypothetical protein